MDTQSNMYQLTINSPKEKGYVHDKIAEILGGNFKTIQYFCMADEMGSCYHTHVFVVFSSRVRFSTVKKQFPEAHILPYKRAYTHGFLYQNKIFLPVLLL